LEQPIGLAGGREKKLVKFVAFRLHALQRSGAEADFMPEQSEACAPRNNANLEGDVSRSVPIQEVVS